MFSNNGPKQIGDEISRGARAVASAITPVSVVRWGVIPGAIASLCMFVLLIYIGIDLTGKMQVETCAQSTPTGTRDCKMVEVSKKWNILLYIIGCPMVGVALGAMVYQLVFRIKNPIFTASVTAGNMVAGIFRRG
tara:strand:- start:22 stop:426 length:405 start_codon:yes stop_codon:yes gene_type:complete